MSKPSSAESARPKRPFDLHVFLLNAKIITVEIASAIAFVWMVVRALIHDCIEDRATTVCFPKGRHTSVSVRFSPGVS